LKKHLCIVLGISLGFVLGYGFRGFLVRSEGAPPSDFQSRVVDTIPGKAIVEFFGEQYGVNERVRYLQDDSGLRALTLSNLSWYIAEKHGGISQTRDEAIRDLIALHNTRETILLSSVEDIPGFEVEQLDPDFRNLSLARLDIPDSRTLSAVAAGHRSSSAPAVTITVLYTWTRVGGELKRYRFRTYEGKAPYCYSCISLQDDLGDSDSLSSHNFLK